MSDTSQPHDPSQGGPTGSHPEEEAVAGPDASGSRWDPAGEEAAAGVADAPTAAPQPVPMIAHPAGGPFTGDPTTQVGATSWAGRLGLRGDGAGPSPWARRVGLAGAAAALVAVGGVGGYAVGSAANDGGDGFSPTSFQVDRDGDRGGRHGSDGERGLPGNGEGFRGEGLPGQGDGYGAPGDDDQPHQSGTPGTAT